MILYLNLYVNMLSTYVYIESWNLSCRLTLLVYIYLLVMKTIPSLLSPETATILQGEDERLYDM